MTGPVREPSAEEAAVSLGELLATLERRWRTVVAVFAVVVVVTLMGALSRSPAYRASATLLIDGQGPTSGVLAQLAAISSAPAAASEMALIRSRQIASRTVAEPEGFDVHDSAQRDDARQLGLTTLVDDARFSPSSSLLRRLRGAPRPQGRLTAWVVSREQGAPDTVNLKLLQGGRVRVSGTGWGPFGPASEEYELVPGETLDFHGLRFDLHAEGDLSGCSFRLRSQMPRQITASLMERVTVLETERNSGVVQVTVEDSDPLRAARVANAICDNYLDLSIERGRMSANLATVFIDEQLAEHERALAELEQQVASQKARSPESIDLQSTGAAIVEQLAQLEGQKIQSQLVRTSLEEALQLIEEGSFETLSRANTQNVDPVTMGYLEAITRLIAEAEVQDRTDTGPYKLLLQTKLAGLHTKSEELELERERLQQIAVDLAAGEESALARLRDAPGMGEPLTESYLIELGRLNAEINRLRQEYTEEYPELSQNLRHVRLLREQIGLQLESRVSGLQEAHAQTADLIAAYGDQIDAQPGAERAHIWRAVDSLVRRTTDHLQSRLAGIESHVEAVGGQIELGEQRLSRLPELQREQAHALRQLAARQVVVELLLRSRQESEIVRAATLATATMIDYAEPPLSRHSPRLVLTLGLAAALGLLLGIGATLVHERLRGSMVSAAELEAVSGLPVVGTIPEFGAAGAKSTGKHFIALRDDPDGPAAEAYRSLRANLRFSLFGDSSMRTVTVTSSAPGEGKTSTNIDLALACAACGQRVLLVDADMRKHSVDRSLGLDRAPGLAEAIEDDQPWQDSVQRLEEHALDVLASGRPKGSPSVLLASPRLETMLDEMSAAYDVVVLDVPPARVVSDIESLAHKLDAVLMLYRSGGVPAKVFEASARTLRQSGANLVGCILNAVRPSRLGYGEYGSYGYGSYYDSDEESEGRVA